MCWALWRSQVVPDKWQVLSPKPYRQRRNRLSMMPAFSIFNVLMRTKSSKQSGCLQLIALRCLHLIEHCCQGCLCYLYCAWLSTLVLWDKWQVAGGTPIHRSGATRPETNLLVDVDCSQYLYWTNEPTKAEMIAISHRNSHTLLAILGLLYINCISGSTLVIVMIFFFQDRYRIMARCWAADPGSRPKFETLAADIKCLLDDKTFEEV